MVFSGLQVNLSYAEGEANMVSLQLKPFQIRDGFVEYVWKKRIVVLNAHTFMITLCKKSRGQRGFGNNTSLVVNLCNQSFRLKMILCRDRVSGKFERRRETLKHCAIKTKEKSQRKATRTDLDVEKRKEIQPFTICLPHILLDKSALDRQISRKTQICKLGTVKTWHFYGLTGNST